MRRWLVGALALGPSLAWADDHGYRVGPRDVVEVRVYGEEALTGEFVVGDDGAIVLGYANRQVLAGKTIGEIEDDLTTILGSTFLVNPRVDVEVVEYRSQRVEVVGAVKTPGEYFLEGPTTLVQMLARAGNVDTERSSREVRVRSANGDVQIIPLDALLGSGIGDRPLLAGDVVAVPEGQYVFVNGQVGTPGRILYLDGLTASQALSQAGGATEFAHLRGAHVLRQGERLPVNLRRVMLGRDADIVLQPGDQLVLREAAL
jgi:polysaccharide export outer membrane protein